MDEDLETAIGALTTAVARVAESVTYGAGRGGSPAEDAAGGFVGSLTESVMGVTAGLVRIADAIESLAEAVRDRVEK